MIYRKIVGDVTIEHEGTSEEIRGVLDREDNPVEIRPINISITTKDGVKAEDVIEEISKRIDKELCR